MEINADAEPIIRRASAVAVNNGWLDAFGHASARREAGFTITPAVPLRELPRHDLVYVSFESGSLPPRAPKEAWLHRAIYSARSDVGGILRAQPQNVGALDMAGRTAAAVSGHGAIVGTVAVSPDSRLVRDRASGAQKAADLADSTCLVMHGNGAVTTGKTLEQALARMHLLEQQSAMQLAALAVSEPSALPQVEIDAWKSTSDELLQRIADYLLADINAEHLISEGNTK